MEYSQDTTWLERLAWNLYSYWPVLLPIAFIVLTTKFKLIPSKIQKNVIIQWFVYGHQGRLGSLPSQIDNPSNPSSNDANKKKLTKSNTTLTLLWCFFGLNCSYLIWGLLQEKIMTTKYEVTNNIWLNSESSNDTYTKFGEGDQNHNKHNSTITFHDSQFLVFTNRIIAFILSIIAILYNRPRSRSSYEKLPDRDMPIVDKYQAPFYAYIYCSLSNILSSWCQYEALKYVNFTTQVLSKSFKIIPNMIMGKFVLKKSYPPVNYILALLLSAGMFIFLFNQPPKESPKQVDNLVEQVPSPMNDATRNGLKNLSHEFVSKNSPLISGLLILAMYLTFDSFTSNWQKSLFKQYKISEWQMMAATNFYSILLTGSSLFYLGTWRPAFELMLSSRPLVFDCVFMSIMSSIGQLFVYYTLKRFDPVVFAVIMTFRQFVAILLSCAIYGHKLTLGSEAGLFLVFLVIGFRTWIEFKSSRKSKPERVQEEEVDRMPFKVLSQ